MVDLNRESKTGKTRTMFGNSGDDGVTISRSALGSASLKEVWRGRWCLKGEPLSKHHHHCELAKVDQAGASYKRRHATCMAHSSASYNGSISNYVNWKVFSSDLNSNNEAQQG